MNGAVIFADGDSWRDLTTGLIEAEQATVVTRRGTAVLLDLRRPDPRYRRVPLEGGHRMPFFDSAWLPVDGSEIVLTPCGLLLDHARFWYRSTRVRLVLAGLHPDWLTESPYGPATFEAIATGQPPRSAGHPPEACPAHYCVLKRSL